MQEEFTASIPAHFWTVVGPRLKAAREASGMTLRELSKTTGYALTTLNSVENGHDRPSPRLLNKVRETLKMNLHYLATGEGEILENDLDKVESAIRAIVRNLNQEMVALKCAKPRPLPTDFIEKAITELDFGIKMLKLHKEEIEILKRAEMKAKRK